MTDEANEERMLDLRDRAIALHELIDVAGTHGHDLPSVGRLLVATLREAEQLAADTAGGAVEGEA